MGKFKVGDLVKCIDPVDGYLSEDTIYTVGGVEDEGFIDLRGVVGSWHIDRFEYYADPAPAPGQQMIRTRRVIEPGEYGYLRWRPHPVNANEVCLEIEDVFYTAKDLREAAGVMINLAEALEVA